MFRLVHFSELRRLCRKMDYQFGPTAPGSPEEAMHTWGRGATPSLNLTCTTLGILPMVVALARMGIKIGNKLSSN